MKMADRHNNQKAGARPGNEEHENYRYNNIMNKNNSAVCSSIEGIKAGVTIFEATEII